MLKFQVRTLGRERRRQSTPLRDVFTSTSSSSSADSNSANNVETGSISAPNSPWHDSLRARGRSTSVSSLSSASTSSETGQECATIRVYTSLVRPDTDYKTLFANANTTAADLIRLVLNKFRIHFKDPDLFYLMMELTTKHEASDVRHAVALDSGAKPLVLQACYPADRCRFVLHIRQSFQVRIYDSLFCTTSNYKTLMVSQRTTCAEAVRMVMKASKETRGASSSVPFSNTSDDEPKESRRKESEYGLAMVDMRSRKETVLHPEECLFNILYETPGNGQYQLHLRPLRRRRRYDTSNPRVTELEQNSEAAACYRERKLSPMVMPLYKEDYALSGVTSRLGDQML